MQSRVTVLSQEIKLMVCERKFKWSFIFNKKSLIVVIVNPWDKISIYQPVCQTVLQSLKIKSELHTLIDATHTAQQTSFGSSFHWKKKWSHFDLKSWVTGGTKIRPGIPSNLTQVFYSPITRNPGSNFSSISDSTF